MGWFISSRLRDATNYRAYQHRTIAWLMLVLSALALPYAGMYLWMFSAPRLGIPIAMIVVIGLASLKLLAFNENPLWPGQIICGLIVAGIGWICVNTGGISSPIVVWLLLAPVIAQAFRRGLRWAVVWAVIVAAALVGLYMLPESFVDRRNIVDGPSQLGVLSLVSAIGIIAAILILFALRQRVENWLVDVVRYKESRRQAAEARLHREARDRMRETLQAVMHKSPIGIVVHDGEQIHYANPAFHELTGYEEGRLSQSPLDVLFDGDAREQFDENFERLQSRDALHVEEQEISAKDGTAIPVSVDAFWVDFEGESVLMSIVRDLSEQRELQAKMMQIDRMIAVGNLASGVAHEVNNPLSFIRSNIEFLLRRLGAEDGGALDRENLSDDAMRDALCDTLEGTHRIEEIISDLRTISRGGELELEPIEIDDTVESAIKMASNQIEQRAQLVRDYSDVPTIEADRSSLAQVFMNLLINAAQAIPEGEVDENEIRVSTRETDDAVAIEVADTGEGIPEAMLESVFDPFVSTKFQEEGMGLGLSICRKRIRQLGGTIEAESTPGEGSTFRVSIPKRLTPEDSMELQIPSGMFEKTDDRVVVIDDEPAVLRAQKRQLGDRFEVDTYDDAADALEDFHSGERPMLILCDLQMPAVPGWEFLHRLERQEGADWVERVVFVTGGAFTEEAREFLEEYDRPVLDKPFSLEDVLELVDRFDD